MDVQSKGGMAKMVLSLEKTIYTCPCGKQFIANDGRGRRVYCDDCRKKNRSKIQAESRRRRKARLAVTVIKQSCAVVSAKFSLSDKKRIAIENLAKGRAGLRQFPGLDRTWRICDFPGVPCICRLLLRNDFYEFDTTLSSRKLIPYCTEIKCDLKAKRA